MYISEVNAKKCIEKQVNYLVRSLMRRIFVLGPMQKRKKKKNLKCMVNKLVILFYVVSNKVWKKMSQRELLHTALCKKKRAVIAIYDSTVQKISLAHCSEIKMNCKSFSKFPNTLLENENELQKIKLVPILLYRAFRIFPDVKTRKVFFSII